MSEERPRRFQIELMYTMHRSVDTDEKLERIRALVAKAYPDAKFMKLSVAERRGYYEAYWDRLLRMAGTEVHADPDPMKWDDALERKIILTGYEIVKDQVAREVMLRAIYVFLHRQAKDDVSLKEIFEKLKAKDDRKSPVCATEAGKGPVVYRDFGGKALSFDEIKEIEDGGVKFGLGFSTRVASVGDVVPPVMSRKPDILGNKGEGRQIFRLVAVTSAPEPPPDRK